MFPWSHLMETSPLEEGGLGACGGLQCEKETYRVTKINLHMEIHIPIKYLKRLVHYLLNYKIILQSQPNSSTIKL